MAGNRKLTDFFKATTTAPKVSEKGDVVEDTIVVAQNNEDEKKYSSGRTRGLSKGRPSHRGSAKSFSGTASAGQAGTPMDSPRPSIAMGYEPMVKKGKLVVRSSDCEDTDSDSSFGDLDGLLNVKKAPTTSAGDTGNTPKCLPDRSSPVKCTRSRSNGQYPKTETSPTAPSYKFTMASLVMQAEKDTASEAGAARARAALGSEYRIKSSPNCGDGYSVGDSEMIEATDVTDGIHRGLLASIISGKGEEGGFQRVLSAMKRTEALNRDRVWYFFKHSSPAPRSSRAAFPVLSNMPNGYGEALLDLVTQQHSFLAGFFGDMSTLGREFPHEMISWILDDLCFEMRDDLKYAYRRQLRMITNSVSWSYSSPRICRLFQNLGGSDEATRLREIAHPVVEIPVEDYTLANLASVVQLLGESAGNMPGDTKEYAICILARLTMDKCIVENGELQARIEDAIASLVFSIAEEQREELLLRISVTIVGFVTYGPLRLQLLSCFPSHTPCLHLFRRRLALAFFFSDSSYLTLPEDDLLEIRRITRELEKPEFHIDSNTDYTRIASLISILDICIDSGASSSSLVDRNQENTFNIDIDNLAKKLKSMFTKIVDTGASYMARTEAKEVLERVHYRLVFAVRTRERLKNSIFQSTSSNAMDSGSKPQSTITKFLSKGL